MANLFQRILSSLGTKASAAGTAIVATSVGTPMWSNRDYARFADEGYTRNAIAFHCISMIAQSGAYVPLFVRDRVTKKELEGHKLTQLIRNPAPNTTGVELIESALTYIKIAGNSFLEQVGPDRRNAPPLELYSLRPDRMKVIAGRDAIPSAYEYEANGRKVRWDVDPISGASKLLHLKTFHPIDDWYGLSTMEPAAYAVDRHNEAGAHNMAILQNGAVPSGALAFKPVASEGKLINAPQNIIEAAEKRLKERHTGAENSGRPFVLGGNVEWLTFGMSMEALQLTESKLDAARDICTAFGVPFILVVPGQSTYNNNREAKLAFYEETVIPLLSWVVDHLNVWLAPSFGDNIEIALDLDSVDALSIRREEKRTTTISLFDKKLITRAESREMLDFEPLPDLAEFDPQAHEVGALVQLINGGKLSMETGLTQLQLWGLIPKDINPADEADRINNENGGVDGLTGIDQTMLDPLTGKPLPLDPITGKPITPNPPVKKPPPKP